MPISLKRKKLTHQAAAFEATHSVQSASDLLATAASLGLPIPAPTGSTVYIPTLHNPMRTNGSPWVHVLDGCYSTEQAALSALAEYLVDERHHPNRVGSSPWAVPSFWKGISPEDWHRNSGTWKRREREVHNRARDRWVADRSARQIVEELSGPEGTAWQIQAVRVH